MKSMPIAFVILSVGACCSVIHAMQDQDSTPIDSYIARQARQERGEEYREARKVVVGDVNGDGVPDLVVLYTIEGQRGTNNHVQYLAVFVRRESGLVALTHTEVAGKSSRGVELDSVEGNAIRLNTLSYGPNDPSCCPGVKGTTRYVLVEGTLREQRGGSAGRHQ